MCRCPCPCRGQRRVPESCSAAAYLLKQDLPLKLDWQSVLGFPACSQQCLAFYVGTGDLNSGSYDCTVSVLTR